MTSTLDDLKRKIENRITPMDLISSIMVNFENKDAITTDYKRLHSAFFKISSDDLMDEFRFFHSGLYPYSPLLEDVLQRMAVSGLISCMNPIYEKYQISSDQSEKLRKSLSKFDAPQKSRLKELSATVERELIAA